MLGAVAALAAGALTAVCGFAVYRHTWRALPVDVPWGLLLALAGAFAVVHAAGLLAAGAGTAGAAVGWVGTLLVLQPPRPEGDYLLVADATGYALMFGGMAAVAVAVVLGVNATSPRRGGA